MARFKWAFGRTFRSGASAVPLADALRTGNACTTTAPWLLAMVVLLLWRKSLRAVAVDVPRGGLPCAGCGCRGSWAPPDRDFRRLRQYTRPCSEDTGKAFCGRRAIL